MVLPSGGKNPHEITHIFTLFAHMLARVQVTICALKRTSVAVTRAAIALKSSSSPQLHRLTSAGNSSTARASYYHNINFAALSGVVPPFFNYGMLKPRRQL
jgi:hypothetical protein